MSEPTKGLILPNGQRYVPRHRHDGSCPNCGSDSKKWPVLGGGPDRCSKCGYQENGEEDD